jgi:hypothetical protein
MSTQTTEQKAKAKAKREAKKTKRTALVNGDSTIKELLALSGEYRGEYDVEIISPGSWGNDKPSGTLVSLNRTFHNEGQKDYRKKVFMCGTDAIRGLLAHVGLLVEIAHATQNETPARGKKQTSADRIESLERALDKLTKSKVADK